MHHPWRAFRALKDWTLHFAHLPEGVLGQTDFAQQTVTLTHGMTQAERRSTIAHEIQHILRGPVPPLLEAKEEAQVCRLAAQVLLPDVRAIADALAWAEWDLDAAADELWVDADTLRARLRTMAHPAERAYMLARFTD